MHAYTQYLFGGKDVIVRRVRVLFYDGNKYVTVKHHETGSKLSVKWFYLFTDPAMTRPRFNHKALGRLKLADLAPYVQPPHGRRQRRRPPSRRFR